jgi:hypothetical protein
MRRFVQLAAILVCAILIPTVVHAQGSIVGTVKDASGGVLPGVTVETSSPALIEKTRSVVTDGTGQYQIANLPPGIYSVTYSLAGFNTVKRDGVELTGSFSAAVNAELKVGAIEETITVTGETPVVDVQNTTGEKVMTKEIIDTIPNGKGTYDLALLIPGVTYGTAGSQTQSVGGAQGNGTSSLSGLAIHGGRSGDQVYLQNGLEISSLAMTSFTSAMVINPIGTQEIAVDTSAVSTEYASGGIRINAVSRDGGNTFRGTMFANFANTSMQGANLTQELIDAGLKTPDTIHKIYDINPGFGGPIKKDRLWFFESIRYQASSSLAADAFYNLNANNPNAWTYVPDPSRPGVNDYWQKDQQLRLSWQATPTNKFGVNWHDESQCFCPSTISSTTAPEAAQMKRYPLLRQIAVDWTSPLTSRLLAEAGALLFWASSTVDPTEDTNLLTMIPVTEQTTGLAYRGMSGYRNRPSRPLNLRGSLSYITGSHALKFGFNQKSGPTYNHQFTNAQGVAYQFNNGVPNQITEFAYPFDFETYLDHALGIFAQDKWTVRRLTVSGGVRFDYLANHFPESSLGPTALTPTRNLTFAAKDNLNLKDLTPHVGAAYDLFGNGKTALKVTVNKYLQNLASDQIAAAANPAANTVTSTTRAWTDGNRNFVPDCDLANPNAQDNRASGGDLCAGINNRNFGTSVINLSIDPAVLRGWGKRAYNWEFSAGVQQEVLPRTSIDVSYFRRIFGNMLVTDSRAIAASDYDAFSIAAPAHALLPGGGGYTVSGLYNLNPSKFGLPPDDYLTFADTFGKEYEHWNGIDINLTARPRNGILLQGGVSSGKRTMDNCDIVGQLPELLFGSRNNSLIATSGLATIGGGQTVGVSTSAGALLPAMYCHQDTGFQSNAKFLGSYTIPKVAVVVAGTFQSLAGPPIGAQYNAPNAVVAASLGRSLSGNAANQSIDLVSPGSLWGDRLNQLDLRFSKILSFGRTRTSLQLDVYNALNGNTITAVNNSFAVWQRPTSILLARFAKVGVQFDF